MQSLLNFAHVIFTLSAISHTCQALLCLMYNVQYPIACACHVKVRYLDCYLFHRPEFTQRTVTSTCALGICVKYLLFLSNCK